MGADPLVRLVDLPGGRFRMGTDDPDRYPGDGEGPVRDVELAPFSISATAVTTAEFAAFVDAAGHVTTAEEEGWSFVFGGHLPDDFPETRGVVGAEWWRQVHGADWRHPEGPHSDLAGRADHPVAHLSWFDATAFAGWAGARLPTEAEWEYAARAGAETDFSFGGPPARLKSYACYAGNSKKKTDRVGTKKPNAWGLHDLHGNVLEWCHDVYHPGYYRESPAEDPRGPAEGRKRVLRGGSWKSREEACRATIRIADFPGITDACFARDTYGFRCVRRLTADEQTRLAAERR